MEIGDCLQKLIVSTQKLGESGLLAAGGPSLEAGLQEVSEIQAPLPNSGLFKKSTRDF